MPEWDHLEKRQAGSLTSPSRDKRAGFRHVMACVDFSPVAPTVIAHAVAMAEATGARLTVMQVVEPPAPGQAPIDPVEWGLRLRETKEKLGRLATGVDHLDVEALILEGSAAERICQWAAEHDVDLTVLGTCGESGWFECGLGGTARRVAESLAGSILLLPGTEVTEKRIRYKRVMVPLDCSSRAETALPIAVAIASAHDADLLLVHATPEVELVEVGPLEAEDLELRNRLRKRNERVAQSYLKRVQARLFFNGGATRTRLLSADDPRHALARAASQENADVIVLSSSGLGGHPDLAVGSVADYLINHILTPILLVRDHVAQRQWRRREQVLAQSPRLPSQALS